LHEIRHDVGVTAVVIPSIKLVPIILGKVPLLAFRPRNVMAAVLGWKLKTICLVVCGVDNTDTIENVVLPLILFIDHDRIRRHYSETFHMIIECIASEFSQIAHLIDQKDHRFVKRSKTPQHFLR